MSILVDTNILIPVIEEKLGLLPKAIRTEVELGSASMFVSVVSVWEAAIKHRQGKLPISWPLDEWPDILSTLGMLVVDLKMAHVLAVAHPVPDTKDPFDRMLLAICQVEKLRLLTMDAKLASHPLAWRPPSA